MLPDIKRGSGITKTVQVNFGGLDLRPGAGDGTFRVTKGMTLDQYPLLASRAPRDIVLQVGQTLALDLYGVVDALVSNRDGFLWYNNIMLGTAASQGGGDLIPFGKKLILPWTRQILDLTWKILGAVAATGDLPAQPSEGDAYLVGTNPTTRRIYVREGNSWVDKGPLFSDLEKEKTLPEYSAMIRCGTYQGEDAEWNEIINWDGRFDLRDYFQPGDAVTIQGCVGQPFNNQTLIVRETAENMLRFYENTFKPAMLGTYEFMSGSGGIPFVDDVLYEVKGEDIPAYGGKHFFMVPSSVISQMSYDPTVPDVIVFRNTAYFNPTAPNPEKVYAIFCKWNGSTSAYESYGTVEAKLKTAWSGYSYEEALIFKATDTNPLPNDYSPAEMKSYWEPSITISKKWPEGIQGLFADSNRLWGWVGNQIRCSKLGDPSNWDFFDGVAEDAWAVDVHDFDAFTGGISVHGYPTFFTENKRYRIYGSEPSAYQLSAQDCHGVRSGYAASMAIVNGALYYVSRGGVMQDSGSVPVCVSEALDDSLDPYARVGGGADNCYYLAGGQSCYVLDTRTGVWINEESTEEITGFAVANGVLHRVGVSGQQMDEQRVLVNKPGSPLAKVGTENAVAYAAETNDYTWSQPNRKRVHRVQLRFVLGASASLTVKINYDSRATWETVKTISTVAGIAKQSVYLPVLPRRCDHFRLRFEGSGSWELHSLALDLRAGSAMF